MTFSQRQLKGKIMEVERQHLELDLQRARQEKVGGFGTNGNSSRLNLFLRYLTTARREFYKALNSYFAVKTTLSRSATQ